MDLAKAKGSAETYAMKYMLSKFFLIRVVDEDEPDRKKEAINPPEAENLKKIKQIMEKVILKPDN